MGVNQSISGIQSIPFQNPSATDNRNAQANLTRQRNLTYDTTDTGVSHDSALAIQSNVDNLIQNNSYFPGADSNIITLENNLMEYEQKFATYKATNNTIDNVANSFPNYIIEGVNTDGTISVTTGLSGNWAHLGNIIPSIDKPILSVYASTPLIQHICTTDFHYYQMEIKAPNQDAKTKSFQPVLPKVTDMTKEGNGAIFRKVGMASDNSLIGLGPDYKLYVNQSASQKTPWQGPLQIKMNILDFTICPNDSVYLVGSDNQIYKLPSYKTLNTQPIPLSPAVINVTAISIAPDGKLFAVMSGGSNGAGTISYLESWDHPKGQWLPLGTTCCFKSIATVSTMPEIMYAKYMADMKLQCNADMASCSGKMKDFIANNSDYFQTVGGQVGNAVNTNVQLNNVYNSLLANKKKIDDTLDDYQQLDEEVSENTKYADSQSMLFRILFVVALILLIFTVKELSGSRDMFNDPLSYFFFACVLLASIGLFKGSFGFFLFGILCLGLVLFVTRMNQ
jgi:hypothetical protein